LAIRGNFATVEYTDGNPVVTDRRAGRIPTEENNRIIEKLSSNIDSIDGVKASFYSGMEHRFVLKLTFPEQIPESGDIIYDTDPQETGKMPFSASGENEQSQKVADVLNKFIGNIAELIKDEQKANYTLLRGISVYPHLDSFEEAYGLKAACIATYPMYRGVAKLVGMDVLEVKDNTIASEVETLKREFDKYDFIYFHVKKTDSYGEDGNFDAKAGVIEEFDALVPEIMSLNPDVFVVTGDHSTPSTMMAHSWHPVPIMINSTYPRLGSVPGFSETACNSGSLCIIKSVEIMPLLLAHSDKLKKFGA
jgi:2,3-bisphosphoglycerate-independent phosphoglycerate mutase